MIMIMMIILIIITILMITMIVIITMIMIMIKVIKGVMSTREEESEWVCQDGNPAQRDPAAQRLVIISKLLIMEL